jgi:hypothetical protein
VTHESQCTPREYTQGFSILSRYRLYSRKRSLSTEEYIHNLPGVLLRDRRIHAPRGNIVLSAKSWRSPRLRLVLRQLLAESIHPSERVFFSTRNTPGKLFIVLCQWHQASSLFASRSPSTSVTSTPSRPHRRCLQAQALVVLLAAALPSLAPPMPVNTASLQSASVLLAECCYSSYY